MHDTTASTTNKQLVDRFRQIVGQRHVITNPRSMERFCKGFRSGEGEAVAVVQPGTLLEQWQVLKACVDADKIVIMQAANTGLTEGSTPNGQYDRDAVIISTKRMDKIQLLNDGQQIVSFPGATLFSLEKLMAPLAREPHSVIGSSCIGASIIGGVCNNSGGSLVERGPSYTELSLFAQITEEGRLELVNHLGIRLGDDPETILRRLEEGDYSSDDVEDTNLKASDSDYHRRVREIDSPSPARFNADKQRLHEASGCAGKLAVFAARLDTYPKPEAEKVFYIGTNDTQVLTRLRRHILAEFEHLPVSGEYMHAEIYDISKRYGKDTLVLIDKLGTDRLPGIFAMKGWVDARLSRVPLLPDNLTDRFMQALSRIWPNVLPGRMEAFRSQYEHHLILKMRDGGVAEAESFLSEFFEKEDGDWFVCTAREGKIAGLHRFAAAGAAVRYHAVHENEVEDILALDIALRRDDRDWFEVLPAELEEGLIHKLYYGHFFCHVLHQDYIVKKGVDPKKLKEKMLQILDERGAEYPAEHNVGHLYAAKPDLANFYKECDPTNTLNPGIGKMSRRKCYH
ncbi:D-lactate dehydrogenase [Roseibium album]|uniref:Quinone-dependent D-lactate dehydrogenase n=1 Tax=Roseibium album TaxID=311410 RepID=A0A0M7AUN1_9HYPH|nr:D-lactate dehydrogenase [Roseibium album]CTQ62768.1 D-lactate dehydrogenase [Roseibium album]CTQ78808.1 D-lactate dehydrogenase [Roseibium album]CTQ80251.1 D-lactate dehydrogenase [Roseibium album]